MIPEIDRINRIEYLADLSERRLDEVRAMRAECNEIENAASYVRRFAQARLDILATMQAGIGSVEFPDVLSTHETIPTFGVTTPMMARPPQDFSPNLVAERLLAELDEVAPVNQFAQAEDDSELAARLMSALSDFEREISNTRHRIHEIIDSLQGEVVRRYKDGEASVDALLGA